MGRKKRTKRGDAEAEAIVKEAKPFASGEKRAAQPKYPTAVHSLRATQVTAAFKKMLKGCDVMYGNGRGVIGTGHWVVSIKASDENAYLIPHAVTVPGVGDVPLRERFRKTSYGDVEVGERFEGFKEVLRLLKEGAKGAPCRLRTLDGEVVMRAFGSTRQYLFDLAHHGFSGGIYPLNADYVNGLMALAGKNLLKNHADGKGEPIFAAKCFDTKIPSDAGPNWRKIHPVYILASDQPGWRVRGIIMPMSPIGK